MLNHNADCLGAYREDSVRVSGHADDRGTDAYNLALGEQRANAIRRSLARLGVDEERISTISYGEFRPARRGSNEGAWRLNRRAVFEWR
jgi:peptidoglycan-associated lipoprotein